MNTGSGEALVTNLTGSRRASPRRIGPNDVANALGSILNSCRQKARPDEQVAQDLITMFQNHKRLSSQLDTGQSELLASHLINYALREDAPARPKKI